MKAEGACYAVRYSYRQRCVAECSGVLTIPADVYAKGKEAVHEYIRENEVDAKCTDIDVQDWNEEVEGSMRYENA